VTHIKFCGLKTPDSVDAAVAAGAGWIGFNFFPPSPRAIAPDLARSLIARMPSHVGKVAVLVDPDDALIDAVLAAGCDVLQFHGAEPPERLAAAKARTGAQVWRASGVKTRADITAAIAASRAADRLLLDAKASTASPLPGGNGLSFDWRLLDGIDLPGPWGLSGGLDAGNVGAALALLRPAFVDVSSGIEDAPGVKSVTKIRAFAEAVRSA
jgi:phosphoribosylanthranilate isomerase